MSNRVDRRFDEMWDWVPVSEHINMGVTAQTIEVTVGFFDYITSILLMYNMADGAIEWTEFLVGGALTNGIQFMVDGRPLGPLIKTLADFAAFGIVFVSPTDLDAGTVSYIFQAEMDLRKVCGTNLGMQIQKAAGDRKLSIVIGDDCSGASTILTANIYGWKRA